MFSNNSLQAAQKKEYLSKPIVIMLALLWFVSVVLIIGMLNDWGTSNNSDKKGNKLSLDNMLLSFGELEAGKRTTFINLQLKDIMQDNNTSENTDIGIHKRKEIYDRILERKIRNDEPGGKQNFSIKPVPQ